MARSSLGVGPLGGRRPARWASACLLGVGPLVGRRPACWALARSLGVGPLVGRRPVGPLVGRRPACWALARSLGVGPLVRVSVRSLGGGPLVRASAFDLPQPERWGTCLRYHIALAICAVVEEWFGVWRTYVEYASLHQRPSCFIVAGGRPALAEAEPALILKLCVL